MFKLSRPAAALVAAAAVLWVAPSLGARQTRTPPEKYSGQWRLNPDLSSQPPADEGIPQGSAPEGGGGRSGGGYGGRGGRGGGGMGGYGGGMGGNGGGFGRREGGGNQKQMIAARALMREAFEAPAVVTIVATAGGVSFTDDQGMVSRFVIDGKKEKVTLGGADVEATSSWEIDSLAQQLQAGSFKVKRTWQVSDQGNQMVLEVEAEGGRSSAGQPGPGNRTLRFVYDRVSQGGRSES